MEPNIEELDQLVTTYDNIIKTQSVKYNELVESKNSAQREVINLRDRLMVLSTQMRDTDRQLTEITTELDNAKSSKSSALQQLNALKYKQEQEKIRQEHIRQEQERIRQEQIVQEQLEQERLHIEDQEKARQHRVQLEKERLEQERIKKEQDQERERTRERKITSYKTGSYSRLSDAIRSLNIPDTIKTNHLKWIDGTDDNDNGKREYIHNNVKYILQNSRVFALFEHKCYVYVTIIE